MAYTVKQLSRLAGVSIRTLHYYDEFGLLKPSAIGSNGYRYYDEDSLLTLQQILFYRELEFSLGEVLLIIKDPKFDLEKALESHRTSLIQRINRLNRLIETVDGTLLFINGGKEMTSKQLFSAFSDEEQEKYAEEAEKFYDPEIVKASNRLWKSYSMEKKARILEEGNIVYADMLVVMPLGPESDEVQACVEHWRKHMDYFWTPSLDQLLSLAEGYNHQPEFRRNFDNINPKLAPFFLEAVRIYVSRNNESSK